MSVVERGDASIWWDQEGSGDPVLLIMGLGYPSDMWARVLPELSSRYTAIRLDNRGTGRTGVPPGPYTVETMAADAIAVLDAAGFDRAHVVGASMGGLIAQELALTWPERVRSLALLCTAPGGEGTVASAPEVAELMAARATMTPEEAAEVSIPFVYAAGTPRERIDEDFAIRRRVPTSPEGYANQLMGVVQWRGAYDRLGQIAAPTLVMSGADDRLVNPKNAEVIADAIPGAELVIVEGASHILQTDQPEEVAKHLLAFLERVG